MIDINNQEYLWEKIKCTIIKLENGYLPPEYAFLIKIIYDQIEVISRKNGRPIEELDLTSEDLQVWLDATIFFAVEAAVARRRIAILQDQHSILEQLAQSSRNAVMIFRETKEGQWQLVSDNKVASRLFNYNRDTFYSVTAENLFPDFDSLMEQLREGKGVLETGIALPAKLEASLILGTAGETHFLGVLARDVSKEIERIRSAGRIEHGFKTPLAVILSSVELIKYLSKKIDLQDEQEASLNKYISRIFLHIEKLNNLVVGLIELYKVEESLIAFTPNEICISELVEESIDQICSAAEEKGVSLTWDIQPGLESWGDRKTLESAFENLLSNAIKYTEAGSVHIKVCAQEGEIIIVVADTGIGIDEEDIPKIFQNLFRAQSAREFEGTGIGLNIVKQVIETHKGTVDVQSELNVGTTFTIRLPLHSPGL